MRLLLCAVCKSLEELPDYVGPVDGDRVLEELVRQHRQLSHMKSKDRQGRTINHESDGIARLFQIDDDQWLSNRDAVIKQINTKANETGFDGWVYEARNTYAEDALKCFSRHGRPTEGCVDYWDDSKRIGRPTAEGRLVIRENYRMGERDPHLCMFCPVHSYVTTMVRWKKGMYKEA